MRPFLIALTLLCASTASAQINFYDPIAGRYRDYSPAPYMGGYVYSGGAYRRPYVPLYPAYLPPPGYGFSSGFDPGWEIRQGRRDAWIRYYTGAP